MADPFSIIGLLAVAMNGVGRAVKFVEGIRGAPRAIAKLDAELKAISKLLNQIQSFVHELPTADTSARDSFMPHLETALDNCRDVALDIENLLRPYVKSTEDPQRSSWRRITWPLKEQKIAGVEKDMATCKQTLNTAISFANYAMNSQSSRHVLKIERGVKQIQMNLGIDNVSVINSDFAGSVDTTYKRTSQWIMQTGTVHEEATEESLEEEYYEPSLQGNVFFSASEKETQTRDRIPQPTMPKTVESAAQRPNKSTWLLKYIAKQTQPPVTQKKAAPASKILQWRPAQIWQPAPQPQVPPTQSENGQLIRKTKVSREALQSMQIEYSEEGSYVRLPERIDAEKLKRIRNMSQSLCANSKLWWTDPSSKPAVMSRDPKPLSQQVLSPSPASPSKYWQQNDGNQQYQTLRKTIVSRSALQRMRINYSEDANYVFISQMLDAATVRTLRNLSRQSEDPRAWWN